jgi:hypothetical protein
LWPAVVRREIDETKPIFGVVDAALIGEGLARRHRAGGRGACKLLTGRRKFLLVAGTRRLTRPAGDSHFAVSVRGFRRFSNCCGSRPDSSVFFSGAYFRVGRDSAEAGVRMLQ